MTLSCPVCDLKASNWQIFSNHLHTGHNLASVTSVCRRCRGMFRNQALLLAHECFRWGRMNLPCAALYSSVEEYPLLEDFGFPSEGVYIERRCGLCLTSDVIYSNFEQYERCVWPLRKYSVHFREPSLCSFLLMKCSYSLLVRLIYGILKLSQA